MTPKRYKARYERIPIKKKDGSTEYVKVRKYRLNHFNVDTAAAKTFDATRIARGIDTDISVLTDNGEVNLSQALSKRVKHWSKAGVGSMSIEDPSGRIVAMSATGSKWVGLTGYTFIGKGAPEHCQIVLQLVEHWGLAPQGLQAYADASLGLDCNGFVGNYIWHCRKGNSWEDGGYQDLQGPDSLITNFFNKQPLLSRWEDISAGNTYIFGKADDDGNIIPGGGGIDTAGHIMITEPNETMPGTFDPYSPRVFVVESTLGALDPGLSEGWYECLSYDKKKRTFKLFRGSKIKPEKQEIQCKIALLT